MLDPHTIASYLLKFGFSLYLKETFQEKAEVFDFSLENRYKVLFIKSSKKNFWDGIIVSFSGQNASYFYDLIKNKKINLAIFDLSRTN